MAVRLQVAESVGNEFPYLANRALAVSESAMVLLMTGGGLLGCSEVLLIK